MRLTRPRLRSLILAVGLVALPMGGLRWLVTRRAAFLSRAASHDARIVGRLPGSVGLTQSGDAQFRAWGGGLDGLTVSRRAAKDRWHGELRDKYHRAAARPWLPVAPDPPEPQWAHRPGLSPVEPHPARHADPYDLEGPPGLTISPDRPEAK